MIDLGAAGVSARRAALTGTALALGSAAAYGINIVYARISAQSGVSGADLVVYRALAFAPLLAIFAWATGRRLALPLENRALVWRFAASTAGTALFYLTSLKHLPIPLAVTIFYTYPLIVILLTPYLDRVRLPVRRWIAALVAFAGVALAVGPHLDAIDPYGAACAFAGSLCCAAMFINGSRLTGDSIVTFFWCQLMVIPLGIAFAWLSGGLSPVAILHSAAIPVLITGGSYFIGFLLQITASPRISAATAGLLFLFEPITAILGSVIIIGETLTLHQALGMILVIGALAADFLPGLFSRPRPLAASPDP